MTATITYTGAMTPAQTVRHALGHGRPLGPMLWALLSGQPRAKMPADLATLDDEAACQRAMGHLPETSWGRIVRSRLEHQRADLSADSAATERARARIEACMMPGPVTTQPLTAWGEQLGCIGARRASAILLRAREWGYTVTIVAGSATVERPCRGGA